jgi:four helix bundle protein
MRDFRELIVWQKAHQLTLDLYIASRRFPSDERFGLTSQLRRAAVSIGANIAEGCGRETGKELARHLAIAGGSTSECECLLQIAVDLGFGEVEQCLSLIERTREVRRMLLAYRRYVETPET